MDSSQSNQLPSSNPPSQMHNIMHMQPFFLCHRNQVGESTSYCFKNLLTQNMLMFWNHRLVEIRNSADVRCQHLLPFARIRKIMKSDKQVKMISADTPKLFAKACEIFILELTLRAWMNTEYYNRRILQRCDVAKAIRDEELLDFLTDFVPLDGAQEEIVVNSPGDAHQCPVYQMNTHQSPNYPMNLHNLNSALLMRSQEAPRHLVLPPSFSSAETNYRQNFNSKAMNLSSDFHHGSLTLNDIPGSILQISRLNQLCLIS